MEISDWIVTIYTKDNNMYVAKITNKALALFGKDTIKTALFDLIKNSGATVDQITRVYSNEELSSLLDEQYEIMIVNSETSEIPSKIKENIQIKIGNTDLDINNVKDIMIHNTNYEEVDTYTKYLGRYISTGSIDKFDKNGKNITLIQADEMDYAYRRRELEDILKKLTKTNEGLLRHKNIVRLVDNKLSNGTDIYSKEVSINTSTLIHNLDKDLYMLKYKNTGSLLYNLGMESMSNITSRSVNYSQTLNEMWKEKEMRNIIKVKGEK